MQVTLRLIENDDLETLHRWMNEEHLFPYYMQEPISIEAVHSKFRPRVGGRHKTKSLFACANDTPFGYLQWYLNASYPDYGAAVLGKNHGFSIDYFIGETAYLGKALGSVMLRALAETIIPIQEPEDRIAFVAHDNLNKAAIRCTKRAGFVENKFFVENEKKSTLFAFSKMTATQGSFT